MELGAVGIQFLPRGRACCWLSKDNISYSSGVRGNPSRHWLRMGSVQVRISREINGPGKLPYSGGTTAQPNSFDKEMRRIQLLNIGG